MRNDEVLEDDVVVRFELDADHWPFVADQIDLFLDVALLHDDARLLDWELAAVDALYQVDSRERLNLRDGLLQRTIGTTLSRVLRVDQGSLALLSIYTSKKDRTQLFKSYFHHESHKRNDTYTTCASQSPGAAPSASDLRSARS